MADSAEIRKWVTAGKKKKKCTHVLIVCDTFDHDDYPVEVMETEDVHKKIAEFSMNMQRVMEVYSMQMDLEKQFAEFRANHPDHK